MSLYDRCRDRFPELVAGLANAAARRRMAHAYLVYGDVAATRDDLAVLTAQFALCARTGELNRPCGECPDCRRLEAGTYPEFITLRPAGKAYQIKVGDSGGRAEANTLRWFQDQLYLSSAAGSGKIGVIYDIDRMNPQSQNAFLKTLEEPPNDTLLLLLTGHPEQLLPTTRSRCQMLPALENRVAFDFPEAAELTRCLGEMFFTAQGRLDRAAAILNRILALAETMRAAAETEVKARWQPRIDQAAEYDNQLAKRMTEESDDIAAGEYRARRDAFLSLVHTFFAQLQLLSAGAAPETLPNPELFAETGLPGSVDPAGAERAVAASDKLLGILRFNVLEELAWRNWMLEVVLAE